jgi:hypothetical protein
MRKAAGADLKSKVLKQIVETPQNGVWTASDFVALGRRSALDKVLQARRNTCLKKRSPRETSTYLPLVAEKS